MRIADVSVIVAPSGRIRVGTWPQGLVARKLSGNGVPTFESSSISSNGASARVSAASTTNPPEPGRL